MIHIDEYCVNNNIKRWWAFQLIKRGELPSITIKNKTYILQEITHTSIIPTECKTRWNLLISKAISLQSNLYGAAPADQILIKEEIKQIVNRIIRERESLDLKGITIRGYDYKSLRRKITIKKTKRQTRSDKFTIKNHILISSEVQSKILSLANYLYFQNATSNFSLLTDIIVEHSKRNEEFYEIAAVPRSTLYKFLNSQYTQSGARTIHQFLNHFNLFHRDMPKVAGAFTHDTSFMQYILGDDNLRDTYSVLVWDATKSAWVTKRARIWLWTEALTMYPLGWIIKVGDFTARDIILSLSQVLLQYGLPTYSVVVDNGIGRSQEFENFLHKLDISVPSDPLLMKVNSLHSLQFSEAYTPTNKAPIERSFGMHKMEFDTFSNNFVGPDKQNEARHRGLLLSPEEALDTFESYKTKLEAYLTGFYIERPRNRSTKSGRIKISIKDFFNKEYQTFNKTDISKSSLRYALTNEDIIKKFSNNLKFKGFTFMPSTAPPFSFYNRKFKVLYNPTDLNEIDLYTLDDIINEDTGEMLPRGSFVMTLQNMELSSDKHNHVKSLKKEITKRAKQLAVATVASHSVYNENLLPDKVSPNADILAERKLVEKEVTSMLTQKIQEIKIESHPETTIDTSEPLNKYTLEIDTDEETFTTLTEE